MKRLYKEKIPVLLFVFVFLGILLCSCKKEEKEQEDLYQIYYLGESGYDLSEQVYQTATKKGDSVALVEELALQFQTRIDKALDGMGKDLIQKKGQQSSVLILDLKDDFLALDPTEQLFLRAAIVKTFTQIEGIKYVKLTVEDQELLDSMGNAVGLMKKEDFVENSSKEINSYVYSMLKFYYPVDIKEPPIFIEQKKKVYYSSNVPIERVVLEESLKRNSYIDGLNFSIPDIHIISVTVADKICYVNLSRDFLKFENKMEAECMVYSIVNALVANCFVEGVQFSVEGDSNVTLADDISLRQLFKASLNIVEGGTSDD